MHWFVFVTFVFLAVNTKNETGVYVETRECRTWQCVEQTEALAEKDPAVIRYQVITTDDFIVKQSPNVPVFPPLVDAWKS